MLCVKDFRMEVTSVFVMLDLLVSVVSLLKISNAIQNSIIITFVTQMNVPGGLVVT